MNVGIVIDPTCDLPTSIIERYKVKVIPMSMTLNNDLFIDTRQPDQSNNFYKVNSTNLINSAEIEASTTKSFTAEMKENWLYHFDNILVIAPHRKINTTLQSVRHSILEMQPTFEQLRQQANLKNAFKIRVIESQNGYAGYGIALYQALQFASEKARTVDQLKQPLDLFTPTIETYILPGHANCSSSSQVTSPIQISWLERKKIQLSKRRPVFRITSNGLEQYKLLPEMDIENNFLETIYDKLTQTKLKNHLVNVSFAGNLAQLRVLPAFKALHAHVKNKGGKLVYSVMSPVSGVQLGKSSISVAFSSTN